MSIFQYSFPITFSNPKILGFLFSKKELNLGSEMREINLRKSYGIQKISFGNYTRMERSVSRIFQPSQARENSDLVYFSLSEQICYRHVIGFPVAYLQVYSDPSCMTQTVCCQNKRAK